jgi:sirohydrochlorin cobaltochelatase
MAGWLLRAIVMENVAVRADGTSLDLPAGPAFRIEKEIKNVVTVAAKTSHYWSGHMPRAQQRAIASLFDAIDAGAPLVEPATGTGGVASATGGIAARLSREAGVRTLPPQYAGWLGVECASVRAAIWMMRALVVSNVLSRREGTTLFVPVNPLADPEGIRVSGALAGICHLATVDGVI